MIFFAAALLLNALALIATVWIALTWGGGEERTAALGVLAASLASQIASFTGRLWEYGPEYGIMAIDLAYFVALAILVSHSRKFWPLWAAAAQLVAVVTHLARWLDPSLARHFYAAMQPMWVFPVFAAIIVGSLSHRTAVR